MCMQFMTEVNINVKTGYNRFILQSCLFLPYRNTVVVGARRSLNIERRTQHDCPLWILHPWILGVLIRNLALILALFVSCKIKGHGDFEDIPGLLN